MEEPKRESIKKKVRKVQVRAFALGGSTQAKWTRMEAATERLLKIPLLTPTVHTSWFPIFTSTMMNAGTGAILPKSLIRGNSI